MTLPFENDTSAVIHKLTRRSLKANKRRNFFLVMAIMLTTLLIGSVFSVGMIVSYCMGYPGPLLWI